MIELLNEYLDVFFWSYQDTHGLDTNIIMHKLLLMEEWLPIKKKLRRTQPDMALKIREDVRK